MGVGGRDGTTVAVLVRLAVTVRLTIAIMVAAEHVPAYTYSVYLTLGTIHHTPNPRHHTPYT